jgi:hypothetical protein
MQAVAYQWTLSHCLVMDLSQSHFTADSQSVNQSVSQYVLVSSPLCGRLTRYCFLFKGLCLEFVVLPLLKFHYQTVCWSVSYKGIYCKANWMKSKWFELTNIKSKDHFFLLFLWCFYVHWFCTWHICGSWCCLMSKEEGFTCFTASARFLMSTRKDSWVMECLYNFSNLKE